MPKPQTTNHKPLTLLLRWYKENGRHALPWRKTRDPYAIFISEAMLQQTQVDRVLPFYDAWLKRFPTWPSLARAKTEALIRAWAGLGYNRRALYVREAARIVADKGVPKSVEEWRALPGMGPYASAAVFSFTKRVFVPAIDTNVRRVIGRIFLGILYPSPADDRNIADLLQRFANAQSKPRFDSSLTYALMDFGSAICLSRSPRCADCPLRNGCRAWRAIENGADKVWPRRDGARRVARERIHPGKIYPDRIFRGRILALVRDAKGVEEHRIGPRVDPSFVRARDKKWMRAMIDRLIADGFLERRKTKIMIVRT
jgi:A/G-specific adenine glycosylase